MNSTILLYNLALVQFHSNKILHIFLLSTPILNCINFPLLGHSKNVWLFPRSTGSNIVVCQSLKCKKKAFEKHPFGYINHTLWEFSSKSVHLEKISIFGFMQFLEPYWVGKTQILTRSLQITLRNSFGCLKIVSKVKAKPKFGPSFMSFTIRGR